MEYPQIFSRAIEVVLRNEGGYSNRPSDKGGETNFGISKAQYPNEDIKNLTKDKAIAIYYRDYWIPMDLEILSNTDLILQLLDMGVLAGPRTAIKLLQRLVGTIADGFLGQMTLKAINEFDGDVVDEYTKRRKLFYVTLVQKDESQRPNLKGWINRISKTHF
jgi:lysozyme family protein